MPAVTSSTHVPHTQPFSTIDSSKQIATTPINWFAGDASSSSVQSSKKSAALIQSAGLQSIDELSKTLLEQSKSSNVEWKQFKSSEPPVKMSLNQLSKTTNTVPASSPLIGLSPAATDNAAKSTGTTAVSDVTLLAVEKELQSLADVSVALESIQPGSLGPKLIYDKNNIKIVLHFGKDRPRSDVQVIVISVTSSSTSQIKNFSFQASVPKVLKVKLQPASGTDLPAYNPILPMSAISQVMLIAHPHEEMIRLKFKIMYTVNNGEMMMDVGELEPLTVG